MGMEIGEFWSYRESDRYGVPQRVAILGKVRKGKTSVHYEIELASGKRKVVPGARLVCPWSEADDYEQDWRELRRVESQPVDEVEGYCALVICEELIGFEKVDLSRPDYVALIDEPSAVEELLGQPLNSLLEGTEIYQRGPVLHVSAEGTVRIARSYCEAHPDQAALLVREREVKAATRCKEGTADITPQRFYEWYLEYDRPRIDVLREWVGYRAMSQVERLIAAEAEVGRLRELLRRAIDELAHGHPPLAESLTRQVWEDEITAANVRPYPQAPHRCPPPPPARRWGWR